MNLLLSFVGVFGLAFLAGFGVRALAHRRAIFDVANERSSHVGAVATGGGLPIVLLTLLGAWLYALMFPVIDLRSLVGYTIAAIMIAGISWLDDLYSQPNWLRFSIHSLAAGLAIYTFGFFPLSNVIPGNLRLIQTVSVVITFLWIVGLTNAYNFMDGIDGIAGGQAIVAGIGWSLLGSLSGQRFVLCLGVLLTATALGFLMHNWPPARMFMGDVGSAFLGFTLAVLPLVYSAQLDPPNRHLGSGLVGLILVWPFVFDSSFTFLRRLSHGERVFSAHRSHLYQRLVITGQSHRFVSLLYIVLAAIGLGLALGFSTGLRNYWIAVAIILPMLCGSLWVFVHRRELANKKRPGANLTSYADTL